MRWIDRLGLACLLSLPSACERGPHLTVAEQKTLSSECGVLSFRYYFPSSNQQMDGAPDTIYIEKKTGLDLTLARQCVRASLYQENLVAQEVEVHPSEFQQLEDEAKGCGFTLHNIKKYRDAPGYEVPVGTSQEVTSESRTCLKKAAEQAGLPVRFKSDTTVR